MVSFIIQKTIEAGCEDSGPIVIYNGKEREIPHFNFNGQ
jgi:hypothetical protein